MTRFSLDVDGVVANYQAGLAALMEEHDIGPLTQPVGLKPEELDALMQERQQAINTALANIITSDPEKFWMGLVPMVSPEDRRALRVAVASGDEVFWVSGRPPTGCSPADMVDMLYRWLQKHDLPCYLGHVSCGRDKAALINEQRIEAHLDDLVPYITQIALGTQATPYLLRRPWNQTIVLRNPEGADVHTTAAAFDITEVDTIAEYVMLATAKEAPSG